MSRGKRRNRLVSWFQDGFGFSESHCGNFVVERKRRSKGYVGRCVTFGDPGVVVCEGDTQNDAKAGVEEFARQLFDNAIRMHLRTRPMTAPTRDPEPTEWERDMVGGSS